MTDIEHLIEDQDDDSNLVKDLRAQLRKASADKKALEADFADLKGKVRESSVTEILKAKGVNAKVAKLLPSDVSDEDGVTKWLEEYGDVFGVSPQSSNEEDDDEGDLGGVDPNAIAALARAQNASREGSPDQSVGVERQIKSLQELGAKANNLEEFLAGLGIR